MGAIGVRVDAKSPHSGMHHVIRSLSLAIELSKQFYDVYFFTKHEASFEKIKQEGFNVFKITDTHSLFEGTKRKEQDPIGENPGEVMELFKKHAVDTLILDMPLVTEPYIKTYRNLVKRIIQIEDFPRFYNPVHVLINGSLVSSDFDYPEIPNQRLILGSEYALVDNALADFEARKPRKVVKELFLHVGSHDRYQLTPSIIETLVSDDVAKKLKINVICDPLFPTLDSLNEISLRYPNVCLHLSPENILDIMLDSDIAITNDIFSIYRLLGCGVPTISFIKFQPEAIYKDKSDAIIESIWNHKYIGLVNEEGNLDKIILKKVQKLIESYSMRLALTEKGQKAVDGLGALRIAEIIKGILK